MKVTKLYFEDVLLIELDVFHDERGFFMESYSFKKFVDIGIKSVFVQDNHSKSIKGTIRGLHFSIGEGQEKLIRCTRGTIWDIVVDIRKNSPTFKKWIGVELNESKFQVLYVPLGFAHGFSVVSDVAEVQYKVSNYYDKDKEKGIKWCDPELNIDWKVETPILSKKDHVNPTLSEFIKEYGYPFEFKG